MGSVAVRGYGHNADCLNFPYTVDMAQHFVGPWWPHALLCKKYPDSAALFRNTLSLCLFRIQPAVRPQTKKKPNSKFGFLLFLRRERIMNLLSYILEIQFVFKMSMP